MSDTASKDPDEALPQKGKRGLLASLELDMRLLGMIGAFILIALVFNILTGGRFLTPRNVFNLTIQTVSVAIMATGMVFVIVTRHIDLSVGSLLATTSAVMAMLQTEWLLQIFGFSLGHPALAWLAILGGLVAGTLIGAFNGYLIGYLAIPAFIVTLGGLLIWRNVGWYLTNGQTIGPLDETFTMFGGISGTLGTTWSWVFAIAASGAALYGLWSARRTKLTHDFPVKPLWAEGAVGALVVAAIMGFIWLLNSYEVPRRVLERDFEARGEVLPEG